MMRRMYRERVSVILIDERQHHSSVEPPTILQDQGDGGRMIYYACEDTTMLCTAKCQRHETTCVCCFVCVREHAYMTGLSERKRM